MEKADFKLEGTACELYTPGGGEEGGRIVAAGTVEAVKNCAESVTGRYL